MARAMKAGSRTPNKNRELIPSGPDSDFDREILARQWNSSAKGAVEGARIKVEHINGSMLLVSGKKDHAWPSKSMSDDVTKRLNN
jgi:hypothetical protein